MSSPPTVTEPAGAGIQRLLIVRLGSMGDIIHTLPAVTALRRTLPDATIGWIVEERWAELLCTLPTPRSGLRSPQRPLVDRIHTVNTMRWRSALFSNNTWEQMAAGLSELRAVRYDVAADFQGAARSALLARWSGAPVIYGVRQPRENIASMFYTRQVSVQGTHIVEQNFSLAEAISGTALPMTQVEFPHDSAADREADQRLHDHGIQRFAIVNPGAGWGAKQWPAERYGYVAKRMFEEEGLEVADQLRPGRAGSCARRGSCQRRRCRGHRLLPDATDRAHPARVAIHRRRHRSHAPRRRSASSRGRTFRPHQSRSQRAVRHSQHRVAQPIESHDP